MTFPLRLCVVSAIVVSSVRLCAHADDWPQWLGPQRDSIWRETGIIKAFPADGPDVRWRAPINGGYAGPAVADGRVFVTDYARVTGNPAAGPSIRNVLTGTERVLCLDARSGTRLWEYTYPCEYNISYPAGPRSTPTVDGDRVYTLGAEGHLACLDVVSGKPLWKMELTERFKCETPYWGFASHPLVDGDKLILVAGGANSVAVALNKKTGDVLWTALSAKEAGYGTPTMIEAGKARQLLIWHPEAINSLDPATGSVHWSVPLEPNYAMSINVPRRAGKYLFVGGIVNKAVMLELDAGKPAVREVWRSTKDLGIGPVHSPPLIVDSTMYGVHEDGELMAIDVPTGRRLWETSQPVTGGKPAGSGTAFLVKNEDRYLIFNELGELIIATLSRAAFTELSRAKIIEPTQSTTDRTVLWTHPAYANLNMYVRNDKELICVSLSAARANNR